MKHGLIAFIVLVLIQVISFVALYLLAYKVFDAPQWAALCFGWALSTRKTSSE